MKKLHLATIGYSISAILWIIFGFIIGFDGLYFLILSGVLVIILEGLISILIVEKIAKRSPFSKATTEEIKREDDVLLQGTPFISAILFFYLNFFIPENNFTKLSLGACLVGSTVTFYVLRAAGKIKQNSRLRFWSAYFFVFLASSIAFEFIAIPLPIYLPFLLSINQFITVVILSSSAIIPILSVTFAASYYPIRYGINPKKKKEPNALVKKAQS